MNPFDSLREYELFVYKLQQQFPRIIRSTLVVAQRGKHHRIPVLGLSFSALNLPFLIQEIEATLIKD